MRKRQFLAGLFCALNPNPTRAQAVDDHIVWKFDNLDSIGGVKPRIEGAPRVIHIGSQRVIQFDGVADALFLDIHPMAGFSTFTFEAIFRPDGGAVSQRWFHIASIDPKTGVDSLPTGIRDPNPRFTFEMRMSDSYNWYLDAFTHGDGYSKGLEFSDKQHPVGPWYVVAQTFDGAVYKSFVNGQLQGSAPLAFKPQGPGHTSIGTRINRLNYFKGAVYQARFTSRALPPEQFLRLPPDLT
jgi:Concanavalin A-like lectin/glucanases superfamily